MEGQRRLVRLDEARPGIDFYRCRICQTHIALITDLVHKSRPSGGTFFHNIVNVHRDEASAPIKVGPHTVALIRCTPCGGILGWKFVEVSTEKEYHLKVGDIQLHMEKLEYCDRNHIGAAQQEEPGVIIGEQEEAAAPMREQQEAEIYEDEAPEVEEAAAVIAWKHWNLQPRSWKEVQVSREVDNLEDIQLQTEELMEEAAAICERDREERLAYALSKLNMQDEEKDELIRGILYVLSHPELLEDEAAETGEPKDQAAAMREQEHQEELAHALLHLNMQDEEQDERTGQMANGKCTFTSTDSRRLSCRNQRTTRSGSTNGGTST